ncbi:gas vesicle protein GvpN [Oscillochloris sp. ZM17-4]|uniref:gas vesicle protein GvpN n=1 Tax=Oscillochloris sp. ZM17-4 TaxID=2866714 RepID=UPI001C737B0E|nr:gas vesicle protein GvpN [Oscillochloris sp. ZM17-4]MBX0331513.1 gas vesicle protein GvpN [Oscillochloris sp. ZM17-4]
MTLAARTTAEQSRATLALRPSASFVATHVTQDISERASTYLRAGFPVHFRGPAGTGKTTLALHVAALIGRPVMLIVGDEEFTAADLVGGQNGYRYRRVVDRFIHSVVKYEEDAVQRWVDNRLTTACREGYTLIYDEFTRSRPEANNILLTVLEERMLVLPTAGREESYIRVHPEFRAIFTSNPQEYAGVHEAQDALSDRLITIDLDFYDEHTEAMIVAASSGADIETAMCVVGLVHAYRASGAYSQTPTMRAALMIARVITLEGMRPSAENPRFVDICLDILGSKKSFGNREQDLRKQHRKMLLDLIAAHCF